MKSPDYYVFTLYVKDRSATSLKTYERLAQLCFNHLPGKHALKLLDLNADSMKGRSQNIAATPALEDLPGDIKGLATALNKSGSFLLLIERAQ